MTHERPMSRTRELPKLTCCLFWSHCAERSQARLLRARLFYRRTELRAASLHRGPRRPKTARVLFLNRLMPEAVCLIGDESGPLRSLMRDALMEAGYQVLQAESSAALATQVHE